MPIPALVTALLPSVVAAIPRLAAIFKGGGSEVAERNVAAASAVLDIVTQATGSVNAQAAVEAIQKDPAQLAAATKAVESNWFQLAPADGGGVEGARKAAEAYAMPEGPRFWLNPAFWITLVMLLMPFMLLVDVFYVHPENYSGDLRTQIATPDAVWICEKCSAQALRWSACCGHCGAFDTLSHRSPKRMLVLPPALSAAMLGGNVEPAPEAGSPPPPADLAIPAAAGPPVVTPSR